VPDEAKRSRFQALEELQKSISERKMARWRGETVEVLVEEKYKERWRGRSPQSKLVFFDDPRDLMGQLVQVRIQHTGPWSMSGVAVDRPVAETAVADSIPLMIM
jgi:tRNA-2-methylthio-N6-dimethylallyladenosine synthase